MALHVETPPNPAPGNDWTDIVPGLKLWNITGITAQLATGGAGAMIALDSSGNGRNGAYNNPPFPPHFTASLLPAVTDAACDMSGGTHGTVSATCVSLPLPMQDFTLPFTIEAWVQNINPPGTVVGVIFEVNNPGPATQITFLTTVGNFLQVDNAAFIFTSSVPCAVNDGNPHQVAFTYDGINTVTFYFDGVPLGVPIVGLATTPGPNIEGGFGGGPTFLGASGDMDEAATYPAALTAARIAAHYAAASVSFAAYIAAVLADTPWAYYHLDDRTNTGRTPGLLVTDGTHEVVLIGDGFPATSLPGPYEFSWQPGGTSNVRTNADELTTIGIPQLVIPAGYTIGTRTPDLQAGDQWSNIAIWWDDNIQQVTTDLNPYRYPPGAFLEYQQQGVIPP